jgi:beta-phosphoglucomutase
MTLRAFIFDLDGVLTDSAEYHYLAWKRLADEQGIPFSRLDNEALRGVSRRESLTLLLKGLSISEETAQDWMERKNNYYIEFIRQMNPSDLLPGALQLLQEIRKAGLKIAIASASKNADDVIERIGLLGAVDILCDGYSVNEPKPSPELFLYAARKLGIPPSECVVVEDATVGIQAAHAGGMRAIGLGPPERVGNAELILPSIYNHPLADILAALGETTPGLTKL